MQIESIYTKDEILAMYLNQIYMGKGTYGVQAAAHIYFDKDVWDLGPEETTMLAGMIQLPEHYSPFNHLDTAYKRRATVLNTMVQAGYLTRPEAETIGATEVHPVEGEREQNSSGGFAAYFVEEVRKQLEHDYGADMLYRDGLRVWTTLQPRYQVWMEEALESHLAEEETKRGYEMTRAIYDSLKAIGEPPETVSYLRGCSPAGEDVRTGAILGLVGGRSFDDVKWNQAMQARRQPGSIFKPLCLFDRPAAGVYRQLDPDGHAVRPGHRREPLASQELQRPLPGPHDPALCVEPVGQHAHGQAVPRLRSGTGAGKPAETGLLLRPAPGAVAVPGRLRGDPAGKSWPPIVPSPITGFTSNST